MANCRTHPHQTGTTCLASIMFWPLATSLWHKAKRTISVSQILTPSPPDSCLPPSPRDLDLHLLNPRDYNPRARLLDLSSEFLNPFPLPPLNCWFKLPRV